MVEDNEGVSNTIEFPERITAPPTELDGYDYFAFGGRERVEAVSKEIERLERELFTLDMHEATLEGNPDTLNRMKHSDFVTIMAQQEKEAVAAGKAWVQQGICPCIDCELLRLRSSQSGLRHGLYRLRSLNSTISGSSRGNK